MEAAKALSFSWYLLYARLVGPDWFVQIAQSD